MTELRLENKHISDSSLLSILHGGASVIRGICERINTQGDLGRLHAWHLWLSQSFASVLSQNSPMWVEHGWMEAWPIYCLMPISIISRLRSSI